MDTDFKYVEIVFENCNWIRIPARLVQGLFLGDIREDVWTNFCQQFVNTKHCKDFQITIKNEALKIKTYMEKEFASDISTFERHIKVYKDITHISIKSNKGKKLYIGVPYETKNMRSDINLLQKNKFGIVDFTISSKDSK
jgi:hypothetical protein